jgi:hypothetical protein
MTLITVFPYPNGAVISADSQETAKDPAGNEFKYSVLKLEPERMGNFQLLIAGGGNGEAIDSFIETMRQFLSTSKIRTLDQLRNSIQYQLRKFRRTLHSVGDDSTMHLFIAAHLDRDYRIWKTKSSVLSKVDKADMIGFTAEMYRHTVKEFHPASLPVNQLILLSLRVLDFARQTSTCVDLPYSVVIVRDNGIHVFDKELIKYSVQSLGVFGAAVNKLLLACGDTSMPADTFNDTLKEFSSTASHLRKEYRQAAGERTFRRMFEPGYAGDPVSIIPPGTAIEFHAGDTVVVREETKEEIEEHRKMFETAKRGHNELAEKKLKALLDGRHVLYRGEERIQVRGAAGPISKTS